MPKLITMAALLMLLHLVTRMLSPTGGLPSVHADADYSHIYIEPGTTLVRDPETGGQIQGKVVIDRRTGDVWVFPTASSAPYPVELSRKEPPVSRPIYLGKFEFRAMKSR